ncbi:MAG: T9SS type A sorting domain-containing protein [Bacteroidota bacterium]|nr:T9SS type A sorting domain-containing protein [Bacteroidota bacterium]
MKIKLLTFIAFCLFTTQIAFSQWVQTGGPIAATNINGIFENNGKLYIGTSCALYSSDSNSGKWDYSGDISLNIHAKKGDSLFVGTTAGIMVLDLSSPDSNPVSYGQTLNSVNIYAINSTDTCLYVGTRNFGFKKSKGFSDKWEAFNDGLPYFTDRITGSKLRHVTLIEHLSNVIFCVTPDGLFKTNVSPISWSPASNGIPDPSKIKFLKAIDETIFAGIQNKLYSSSNKSDSWEEVYSFGSTVSSLNKFGDDYYVTTLGNGIYISRDKGVTWSNLNSGLTDLNVTTLARIDTVLTCGTSSHGFFYKKGNDWLKNNEGIICSSVRSMAITSKAIVANDNEKVYSSTNGNSWNEITPPVSKRYFGSVVAMDDTLLLSVENDPDSPFIIYSEDDGSSWKNLNHPVPFGRDDSYSMYISDKTLYAFEDEMMYATDDLGADWWYNLSLPSLYCNHFNGFVVYNSIPFALACGYAELLKLNSGGKWELSNTGLPTDLQLDDLTKTTDALYVNVHGTGMYVSRDAGNSWSFTSNKLDLNDVLDVSRGIYSSTYKGKTLFITTSNGVFYTNDYGQNWKSLNVGLGNKFVTSIKIFNDTLYAGTNGNGIWKHDIKNILLSNTEVTKIEDRLNIYPNPASDFIHIQAENEGNFELKIVDLIGRQILSQHYLSGGKIDISTIQNGTYIIILNSNKGVLTQKLVINR